MRGFIKWFRDSTWVPLLISLYFSVVLYGSWSTGNSDIWPHTPTPSPSPSPPVCPCPCSISPTHSPSPAPNQPSRNKGGLITGVGIFWILVLYALIGWFMQRLAPRWRDRIREKQRSADKWVSLRWKYIPAVTLWLFELIGAAGSPVLSAVLARKISPDEIMLVGFGILAVLFFCISINTNRDFGLIDAFVAIILGVVLQDDYMNALLSQFGTDYANNDKIALIMYIVLVPALRKVLLPFFKFLDSWALDPSERNLTEFMGIWIPTPDPPVAQNPVDVSDSGAVVGHVVLTIPSSSHDVHQATVGAQLSGGTISQGDNIQLPRGGSRPSDSGVHPPANVPSQDDADSLAPVDPRASVPRPVIVSPILLTPGGRPSDSGVHPLANVPRQDDDDPLTPVDPRATVSRPVIVTHPLNRFARGLVSSSLPVHMRLRLYPWSFPRVVHHLAADHRRSAIDSLASFNPRATVSRPVIVTHPRSHFARGLVSSSLPVHMCLRLYPWSLPTAVHHLADDYRPSAVDSLALVDPRATDSRLAQGLVSTSLPGHTRLRLYPWSLPTVVHHLADDHRPSAVDSLTLVDPRATDSRLAQGLLSTSLPAHMQPRLNLWSLSHRNPLGAISLDRGGSIVRGNELLSRPLQVPWMLSEHFPGGIVLRRGRSSHYHH